MASEERLGPAIAALEVEKKVPRVKECGHPLEAGTGKKKDSPQSLQKKHAPADTLILAQLDQRPHKSRGRVFNLCLKR